MRNKTTPGTHVSAFFFLAASAAMLPGMTFLEWNLLRAEVLISELMAVNDTALYDEDGDNPDWVEIHNTGPGDVDLQGWALTDEIDNTQKWLFPAAVLPGDGFLVVFCSGENRVTATGEIHTSFRLSREGEFLGLTDPENNVLSFFAPRYPRQVPDASYGRPQATSARSVLQGGTTARYLVPSSSELGETWTEREFDDAGWASGPTGIGFDRKETPTIQDLVATDVGELMQDVNSSIYVRIPFPAAAGDLGQLVQLRVQYDDGFIAYLNGVEVARRNTRTTAPRYNWSAVAERTGDEERAAEIVPLPGSQSLLVESQNVLAVQVLNRRRSDSDLLFRAELETVAVESTDITRGAYFGPPTPGWPNGEGLPGIAADPEFSLPSGAYPDGDVTLELSTTEAGAEIRFTLSQDVTTINGEPWFTAPTASSALYTDPIPITGSLAVTARTFKPGLLPSPPVTRSYATIHSSLVDFSSNIPLVISSTFGRPVGGNCGGGPYTPGNFILFSPGGDGRSRLVAEPRFADVAGFRKRGSSTCGREKFSFNVEIRDEKGGDKDAQILEEFPPDSDYVMYGPYNFDRALMRNALAYWMSLQVGRWAARVRFVECFLHTRPGPVTMASYWGVYVLMEKNKRHPEKINVERLTAADNEEPDVAGGYVLRRDRVGAGEMTTSAGGYSLVFVYPKQPTAAQRAWITGYINRAVGSLNPNIGSQENTDAIDVMEWLDHHILNWYPKNVDAFRLSGYLFKRRDGFLAMGPIWDYDRTMGCADDNRPADPEGWDNQCWGNGDCGTLYFQAGGGFGSWYGQLFQNQPPVGPSPWARAYRARWAELRQGPLSTANILGQIDAWAAELAEAAERNFNRWPGVRPRFGSFQGEVNHLKNWLARRAEWIDSQFIDPPGLSHAGGPVSAGFEVTMTLPREGQVYYTLNGPDPRGANNDPREEAIVYSGGPIRIDGFVTVRARTWNGGAAWSQLVEASYNAGGLPLRVTEIMYNPLPDDTGTIRSSSDFEFLELQNTGPEVIDLTGVRVSRPSFDFTSGALTSLAPGELVLVVRSVEAFRFRYGEGPHPIAGEYTGTLSNVRQTISAVGPQGEPVVLFQYEDSWYPATDGDGYSLVIRDSSLAVEAWPDPGSWRASLDIHGSPGRADEPVVTGGLQRPGDATQDGRLNISDAVGILRHLTGGAPVAPCSGAEGNRALLDVDGNEEVNLSDAVETLNFLFRSGPLPALGAECVRLVACPEVCP